VQDAGVVQIVRGARMQRVRNHLTLQVDVEHGLGIDACSLVLQGRFQGAGVAGGDRVAKGKVGGQDARRLRQPVRVLAQDAREDLLADAELVILRRPIAGRDPLRGRPLRHLGLLVHGLDILCQPGRDIGTLPVGHFCRHCA